MPSPIGEHSLMGGVIYLLSGNSHLSRRKVFLWTLLFCLVYANLLDLDFVLGIITGELNKYHHGSTHSLVFIVNPINFRRFPSI